MKPKNFLFHLFGKINSIQRVLLFILFITTNSLIYSQQQATCVTDGGLAGETGLKTWCWSDITIPEYNDSKGVDFSDGELTIDSEANDTGTAISVVGDELQFYINPTTPAVEPWSSRNFNMRAEIRTAPYNVNNALGTEEWYGWSYTFGDDYIIDQISNFVFFQIFGGVPGNSPPVRLEVIKDGQFNGHDAGEIYVMNLANNSDYVPTGITPVAGQKLDIVVQVVHGLAGNGLLKVWINGQSVYDKTNIATVNVGQPWGGNVKWGIYKYMWDESANVVASADQGITSITTSMGGLRMITRHSNDLNYLNNDYTTVFPTQSSTVAVTGVSVSPASATINIPETITLTPTIAPADASDQSGVWSSSDTNIATVNNSGVVTSVGVGQVDITFNTNDGGFSDSATITVTNIPIGVESVSLSPETLDLNLNGTDIIVATILPANASDQTGVWTSSNPGVATVDQQGLVQPIAVGETTITFTTNDGGFSDTSIVTINNDSFGDYEFYNADTDALIQVIEGGESFDLDNIGENVNFRVIPLGGDANPEVESVGIQWNGIETGTYGENAPLYAGMTGHIGNDYEPYTVSEGTYNFTVTFYSEDNQSGNVVASDSFDLTFIRTSVNQVIASADITICQGDTAALSATGADSYLWSTGETSQTIAATPDVTTTYTVTGTHSDGSTTEDSVTVTVNEAPTVDAGVDQTICEGESVVLTATVSNGSISWSNGATTASITVNPSQTTTYTITVNDNGCVASDDVTVNVNALPIADAGNDITIIIGESTTLTATGAGTYNWSTGETTSSIVVTPTIDTTYSVIVSNAGCTSEDSVNVIVVEAIVADAGEDVAICLGENTILTASGGFSYLWSNGETTQSISVNPSETTNYSVTVSNQDQTVSDTDSVTVTVFDRPTADVSNDVTIASGQSATLFATGGDTYEWSTGETGNSITVTPATDTTYTVIVYNANGCSDEDTVTIYVIEEVVADAGEDQAICEGDSITLTASGGDTYLWSTGETTESITVNPLNTTTYTVDVSDQYTSDTDAVLVTVNPLPVVSAGEDVTINSGENVTLYGSGGNTFVWSTGETNANISVSPIETTTYTVTATVNGCSDTDEVTVIVISPIEAYAGEDITICNGETAALTATGGDQFEWSTGETTQSIDVDPSETTVYTVRVSNSYGSAIDDVQVNVNDCSLDGPPEEATGFDFRVFPNPTDGILNIKISDLDLNGIIYVTDLIGKRISTLTIESGVGQVMRRELNLSKMPPGFYILNFSTKNRSITKKILLR